MSCKEPKLKKFLETPSPDKSSIHLYFFWLHRNFLFRQLSIKFIYAEKATRFCEISTVDLTVTTKDKSMVEISQNFVAFSEYMNVNCLRQKITRTQMNWTKVFQNGFRFNGNCIVKSWCDFLGRFLCWLCIYVPVFVSKVLEILWSTWLYYSRLANISLFQNDFRLNGNCIVKSWCVSESGR